MGRTCCSTPVRRPTCARSDVYKRQVRRRERIKNHFNLIIRDMEIVIGIIGLIVGAAIAWYVTGKMANSRAQNILSDAEKDAEVIKKKILLEAKEDALAMKTEAEKQANARAAKLQNNENRLKQREMTLNQRQEELNKKNAEVEEVRANLSLIHILNRINSFWFIIRLFGGNGDSILNKAF